MYVSRFIFLSEDADNAYAVVQNDLTGDPAVFERFTAAINNSRLQVLSLTSNDLGDSFASTFFPALDTPHLKELHVSATDISPTSLRPILDFISSRHRCYLQTFKCNGNSLGLNGVVRIVRTIERANWTLANVELYANNLEGANNDSDDTDDTLDEGQDSASDMGIRSFQDLEPRLVQVLRRNSYLKKETEREALLLLKYSRPLLMHSSSPPSESTASDSSGFERDPSTFPFRSLPIELQHSILTFLAPTLSTAQRIKIFDHASSPHTLPLLSTAPRSKPKASVWSWHSSNNTSTNTASSSSARLSSPSFHSSRPLLSAWSSNTSFSGNTCIIDPTILTPATSSPFPQDVFNPSLSHPPPASVMAAAPFGLAGPHLLPARPIRTPSTNGVYSSTFGRPSPSATLKCPHGVCSDDGKCMGPANALAVLSNREQEKNCWLEKVGCERFDPAVD
jgi:hypothetical protein